MGRRRAPGGVRTLELSFALCNAPWRGGPGAKPAPARELGAGTVTQLDTARRPIDRSPPRQSRTPTTEPDSRWRTPAEAFRRRDALPDGRSQTLASPGERSVRLRECMPTAAGRHTDRVTSAEEGGVASPGVSRYESTTATAPRATSTRPIPADSVNGCATAPEAALPRGATRPFGSYIMPMRSPGPIDSSHPRHSFTGIGVPSACRGRPPKRCPNRPRRPSPPPVSPAPHACIMQVSSGRTRPAREEHEYRRGADLAFTSGGHRQHPARTDFRCVRSVLHGRPVRRARVPVRLRPARLDAGGPRRLHSSTTEPIVTHRPAGQRAR